MAAVAPTLTHDEEDGCGIGDAMVSFPEVRAQSRSKSGLRYR